MENVFDELNALYDEKSSETDNKVIAELYANAEKDAPWYTEYFAVQPCIDFGHSIIKNPDDYDDYEDFEADLNDPNNKVMPLIFGPNLTRGVEVSKFKTLEDALNYVLENIGSDFRSENGIHTIDDMMDLCVVDKKIVDNSITIQTETNIDTQDLYGTFMRVSQKPFKNTSGLGNYYVFGVKDNGGSVDLGDLLDRGIVGDPYTDLPNYVKYKFAYQD